MELNTLSDRELLTTVSTLVKKEKETTLTILEYLAEIDSRRLWLKEGHSSLFDFCVRQLNYSEGEAARRIQGCRTLRRFEEVRPVLQRDELSLTGLCLLSPHLTEENVAPLLEEAKRKTTREVEKVINTHFPEARVKARTLVIESDEELESLLERAKVKFSEKALPIVLKRALREVLKERTERSATIKKHTRYVPKRLVQEVKQQSNNQCSYVGPTGIRCNQRSHLQIDHIRPWAKGGSSHDIENLRCLCRAHNLMRGREEFPERARSTEAFPERASGRVTAARGSHEEQHRARDVGRGL